MTTSHRLYVGTIGEGLWRSLDGGDSFTRTCDGMFVECHVRALVVHPQDPHTLLLGNEHGIYRTTTGADQWERIDSPANNRQVWSLLISAHNPQVILAGTCPSRLCLSHDGGRTWAEPPVQIEQECPRIWYTRVTTLRADPVDGDTFWAGIEIDGLRRSRDGGRTWHEIGAGLSSRDIHDLAIVPQTGRPAQMLAATNNDLNLSADGGATWQPLQIGKSMPWSYCRALVQQVGHPEQVLLGNGNGPPGTTGAVGRSSDGGKTWEPAQLPGVANSTIWNFATHPANANLIYASSVSGQVYRSTDGGQAWVKLPREFGEIRALVWAP